MPLPQINKLTFIYVLAACTAMTTAATALAAIATVEVTAAAVPAAPAAAAVEPAAPALDAAAEACAKEDGADNEMIKDIVAKIFKIRIS